MLVNLLKHCHANASHSGILLSACTLGKLCSLSQASPKVTDIMQLLPSYVIHIWRCTVDSPWHKSLLVSLISQLLTNIY